MRRVVRKRDEGFSKQVLELRRGLGLSQEALAVALGVSFATVNRWEKGRTYPSPLALARLREFVAGLGTEGQIS
jgi:putative transcriptional regulator